LVRTSFSDLPGATASVMAARITSAVLCDVVTFEGYRRPSLRL
jgi:hypothetical protein